MDNLFNSMMVLMPTDGWQRLMVDALWQSTLAGVLGLVTARCVVRQAAARAWVIAIALTACVLLPAMSFLVRSAGWAFPIHVRNTELTTLVSTRPRVPESRVLHEAVSDQARIATWEGEHSAQSAERIEWFIADAPLPSLMQTTPKVTFFARYPQIRLVLSGFGVVWLSSSLLLLVRLVASAIAVRRMIGDVRICKDSILLDAVSAASQRVGLTTTPRVLVSNRIPAPMVLAYFRPALLLPKVTTKQHGEKHFATILSHELAHLRRCDGWSRLWVQLIAVVLPLQPLVWWMRRSFFEACEEACDDWAVALGSDPIDLASVLTSWPNGSRDRRELLLAVGMSATRSRVLRLLAMNDIPSAKLSVRWQCSAAVVAILISGGLGFAQPSRPVDQAGTQAQAVQESGNAPAQQQSNDPPAEATNASSKAISITGTCVDENNEPLPNVRVRLFCYGPDSREPLKITQAELQSRHCDNNGRFAFKGILVSGKSDSWLVIAKDPGRATTSTYIATENRGEQPITLKLHPAGTLKGRIVNDDGNSVPGVLVSAGCPLVKPVPGICAAISDAEGYYKISDLRLFDLADQEPRPTGDGAYDMVSQCFGQVQHPDYARDRFPYSKIPGIANVTVRRAAVVEGQVVLKESGSPAMNARVTIWNDRIGPDSWTRATTDEDGRYHIEHLPPGNYRVSIELADRPNLALPQISLTAGSNRQDFRMERGGVVKGRVIDVRMEQPIQLAEGEIMQISASDSRGRWFAGMPSANIQPDGSFTLLMPAGHRYFGMYFGPNWRGVNTDRLSENGIEVIEGGTTELEIRVKPREKKQPPPKALSKGAGKYLAEQAAIAAIKQLGGWVELETIDGKEHVVEVNMVYHEDERTGREENRLLCDECLSYVRKFPKLKRLMLYREQATDMGLANLRGMDSLEVICIWDASAVSDAGAAHLANLKNLRTIHIQNSSLTDESLRYFSGLPKVKKLSLQGNHFTNKGLEYLQENTQLTHLTLGLGTNEITDGGLRFLSELTNLERLGLQSSKITDAGLQHLRSLKNLRDLWIGGTEVTEAGRAELRRHLPKLE